ncbi:RNA polymerase sigma-70 factor [Maribellus comscasis]|uniref:RNA polymerase sigma-70 factor n=1 Tax=Maribellus comscasis TaxID=2681766 RepID=A0A6I6JPZ3_9BACT|nr:RNA polymerase sigma-70 factor [Maribellus comscasis]QGY45046.1 RNA polymerase sigma-70 factor [Maribellus comscasis]
MSGQDFLFKNNKEVFKDIFLEYYQPLCHLSSYYIENEDEARGIVQEAFIKLWELRNELGQDSNIKNFLFTLVKNGSLNVLKRRKVLLKHHNKIREAEIHYQFESLSRINEDYLEFKELKEKIDVAIKNLPEHCRVVFEMSRFNELKNREIAEKIGISQKAVEARMTKALKILKDELKDYLPAVFFIGLFLQ